jgi:hypothetical protein
MAGKAAAGLYADEERGELRVTAHSALPFLVGGVVAANRPESKAGPWRAAFVGAHLVHVRQILRLIRGGGARDPEVRAALALGSVGYGLVLAQVGLLSGPVRTGPDRDAPSLGSMRSMRLCCGSTPSPALEASFGTGARWAHTRSSRLCLRSASGPAGDRRVRSRIERDGR